MDRYYPVQPSQVPNPLSGFEKNANKFEGSYRSTRSSYTTYERVGSLFQEVQVYPGPNSTLMTSQLGLGQEKWVEVKPLVFRLANGTLSPLPFSDELVFGVDSQGNINHFFYVNNPTTAYEKVAWYDGANFNCTLLGACILLFLSTLAWPIRLLFKHRSAKTDRLARTARWLAGGASMLNLLFIIGLVVLSAIAPTLLIYSIPSQLNVLLAIAIIATIIALGSAAFTALVWKNGYWSIAVRLHFSLVVIALLAFAWWLNNWNLLGFRF
jgi:hypothetical protein